MFTKFSRDDKDLQILSRGNYYIYNEELYDNRFPKEWAMNHFEGTGPKECRTCMENGSWNGVFIGYCDNCAIFDYHGERGRGFYQESIEFLGYASLLASSEEKIYCQENVLKYPSVFDTYLKDVDLDTVGDTDMVDSAAKWASTGFPVSYTPELGPTCRGNLWKRFRAVNGEKRGGHKAAGYKKGYETDSEEDERQKANKEIDYSYLDQDGSNDDEPKDYYYYDECLYDIRFPIKWAKDHYGYSGPKNCLNCRDFGSWNGVFIGYCSNCSLYCYEGERGPGFIDYGEEFEGNDKCNEEEMKWIQNSESVFDTYLLGVDMDKVGEINLIDSKTIKFEDDLKNIDNQILGDNFIYSETQKEEEYAELQYITNDVIHGTGICDLRLLARDTYLLNEQIQEVKYTINKLDRDMEIFSEKLTLIKEKDEKEEEENQDFDDEEEKQDLAENEEVENEDAWDSDSDDSVYEEYPFGTCSLNTGYGSNYNGGYDSY